MKITISKSQWEEIGKKGGWMKESSLQAPQQKSEQEIQDVVNKALQSKNPLVISQLTVGWPPIIIQEVGRRVAEQRKNAQPTA